MMSMSINALAACLALPTVFASSEIASSFVDKTYRIERQYVDENQAKALLQNLVYRGVPGENDTFPTESLKVIGDAGDSHVEQHPVANFASVMQNFITPEYHHNNDLQTQNSLIYYIEQLGDDAKYRSEEMIQQVTPNSVLEDGGTVHLYMSAPGAAALGNHTDTTDIVVVQLDGEKEWLLCSEPVEETKPHMIRDVSSSMFSKKLDSCSTYAGIEIDNLDCERSILRPGDALFLPRRVVHSARALSDTFSAHLTFGFNEDEFCWDHHGVSEAHRDLTFSIKICNDSCDRFCDDGCDKKCDDSCDKGWPIKVFSCDRKCDFGCDRKCDESCDSSCDTL